jgi:p-hydroxybenzoate 3-monooxygenase
VRTQVGIVGAGPAGLMLSHLLALAGVESVVLDRRSRSDIEQAIRAGILESGTVELMRQTGLGDRVSREGAVHEGIELRFAGRSARIDFPELTGRSVVLYPQHEVLKDLIAARLEAGGQLVFSADDVQVLDVDTDRPRISFTGPDGPQVLECDVVVGADGSQSRTRALIPEGTRTELFRAYPFGWFGILAEAPPSSEELIYAQSDRGFALISSRTPEVQRMYFQCDPAESADAWSDDRIWAELQARTAMEGFSLQEGRIFSKAVIPMRSVVCQPMQHGRLFLAGDSAHTVPPTGAKGMNLAVADVVVLARGLERFYASGDGSGLDSYTETALRRVWRAQHFSWWMTSMLHTAADATEFDVRRQVAELETVTGSRAGATLLAENYVGLPMR